MYLSVKPRSLKTLDRSLRIAGLYLTASIDANKHGRAEAPKHGSLIGRYRALGGRSADGNRHRRQTRFYRSQAAVKSIRFRQSVSSLRARSPRSVDPSTNPAGLRRVSRISVVAVLCCSRRCVSIFALESVASPRRARQPASR